VGKLITEDTVIPNLDAIGFILVIINKDKIDELKLVKITCIYKCV